MSNTLGAVVTLEWVDTKEKISRYFSFGEYDSIKDTDTFGIDDTKIFFYAEGEHQLKELMTNFDDFKVIEWELVHDAY